MSSRSTRSAQRSWPTASASSAPISRAACSSRWRSTWIRSGLSLEAGAKAACMPYAAFALRLALGLLDLAADLAGEILLRVDVDVRLAPFERVLDAARDQRLPRLAALAGRAERHDHVAGLVGLAEMDVGLQRLPRQMRERELPGQL